MGFSEFSFSSMILHFTAETPPPPGTSRTQKIRVHQHFQIPNIAEKIVSTTALIFALLDYS